MTYTKNTQTVITSQTTLPLLQWTILAKALVGGAAAAAISDTFLAAQKVIFYGAPGNDASADNAKDMFFGPSETTTNFSVGPQESFVVEAPPKCRFNLQNWYIKPGTTNGTLYILYC